MPSYTVWCLTLSFGFIVAKLVVSKRKKVCVAAPIACLPRDGNIASARKAFHEHAQEMLEQGLNEVCSPFREAIELTDA